MGCDGAAAATRVGLALRDGASRLLRVRPYYTIEPHAEERPAGPRLEARGGTGLAGRSSAGSEGGPRPSRRRFAPPQGEAFRGREGASSPLHRQIGVGGPFLHRRVVERDVLVAEQALGEETERGRDAAAAVVDDPPVRRRALGGEPLRQRPAIGEAARLHVADLAVGDVDGRSEEHTSELQSLMRISYAVFCLEKQKNKEKTEKSKKPENTQDKANEILVEEQPNNESK